MIEQLAQWRRCLGATRLLAVHRVHGLVTEIIKYKYESI